MAVRRSALALGIACAAVCFQSALARADAADDLFQRGKDLLDRGFLTEACDTLAQADEARPSVGTIGLLAACHEKQGRVATAWREYRETAKRAAGTHDERERFALDRVAKLEPHVPRLVLRLPVGEKLTVSVNDQLLEPSTLSAAIRLDPGKVLIVVASPHGKHWSTKTEIGPDEERVVEVPSLEPVVAAVPSHRSAAPPIPALVAGGVGVVGIGVMTGFGISAMVVNADSVTIEAHCKSGTASAETCARGESERSRAKTFGNVATVGLAVGGAGIATAALLWIFDAGGTPRAAPTAAASVRFDPGASGSGVGLGVSGAF